jgi:EAL domain-containing protein (putative c-di-GMP-specific phosphodiesterase class I)
VDEQLYERMEAQLTGFSEPVERLRAALDNGELQLYCQPILALHQLGRAPLGELLVRLREEEQALMPPGEFLPLFEHFRMMPQLDRWVVRRALESLAQGGRIGCLTINVSRQTLEDPQFPAFVAVELAEQNVAAHALGFEIDEADALDQGEAARRFAEACRAIGVRVLLDGFGRRSVSFAPIQELGVHFVKVDGAITRKLLSSEVAQNKLEAVVRMSEALGYSVVAECVEDDEVLARLKAMRVTYAQGFGIHEPRPLEALAAPA